jgi:exoribonuclease-2
LRWLLQEELRTIDAMVLREYLVRVDGLPLVTRVSSLPVLEPGTRVRLEVSAADLLERTLSCTYKETLGQGPAVEDVTEDAGQKA